MEHAESPQEDSGADGIAHNAVRRRAEACDEADPYLWEHEAVKTTLELPDALFRRAKSAAAQRGIPLRELVTEALAEKLAGNRGEDKPWMKCFGQLRHLRAETARINERIEREFEQVEPEDAL